MTRVTEVVGPTVTKTVVLQIKESEELLLSKRRLNRFMLSYDRVFQTILNPNVSNPLLSQRIHFLDSFPSLHKS